MTKTELIGAIAENTGVSKRDTRAVVDELFQVVENEVAAGNNVGIIGFGTFGIRNRAERSGRNPQTGDAITIAAHKAPHFKPGKAFKEAVNK